MAGQTDLVWLLHGILDCSRARSDLSAEDIQWLVGIGLSPDGLGHSLARSFPMGRVLFADGYGEEMILSKTFPRHYQHFQDPVKHCSVTPNIMLDKILK